MKALEKERGRRYETAKDLATDVLRHLANEPVAASPPSISYRFRKLVRRNTTRIVAGTAAGLLICSAIVGAWGLHAQARLHWLRTALSEVETFVSQGLYREAFPRAQRAIERFPDDPDVQRLWLRVSCTWNVVTKPRSAVVMVRASETPDAAWMTLAEMPARLPRGMYHFKIDKEGYAQIEGAAGPGDVDLDRTLDELSEIPLGTAPVFVAKQGGDAYGVGSRVFLDIHEVTCEQYKQFLEDGGYQRREFWEPLQPFIKDEKEVSLEGLLGSFRDQTGHPGPGTWKNGTYPKGEASFPVRGISWYEASAYARYRGKRLPTAWEWECAACFEQKESLLVRANYGSDGPIAVGASGAINLNGIYDMPFNVEGVVFGQDSPRPMYRPRRCLGRTGVRF